MIEMWQRECTRSEKGEMRRIPKLLPSYIERDAWTKLNVAPAKIMQVLSCLEHEISSRNLNMVISC